MPLDNNYTKTELTVILISLFKRNGFKLKDVIQDPVPSQNPKTIARVYQNGEKIYCLSYPVKIEDVNINLLKKLKQEDENKILLRPIKLENGNFALVKIDKNEVKITYYATEDISNIINIFPAENPSLSPFSNENQNNFVTSEVMVASAVEAELSNRPTNLSSNNLKEKYKYYYQEETKPLDNPLFMQIGHFTLNGAPIGALIGFAVGSIVPGIGNVVGAAVGAAIGTLVGAGIGLLYQPVTNFIRSKFPTPFSEADLAELDEEEHDKLLNQQNKRDWFRPSRTKVFEPDGRFFMGTGAGAAIGGAIGTLIFPGIGTIIGAGVGAIIGGAAAVIHPILAKKFAPKVNQKEVITRKWYQESTYDVPWYARAFLGASSGAALGALIGSIVPGIGTLIGGAAGTLIGAGVFLASPMVAAFGRNILEKVVLSKPKEESASKSASDQKPPKPAWYKQSMFDMPWYVRFGTGGLGGLTLGTAIGTLIFPGIGTVLGGLIGFTIGATVSTLYPHIYALGKKIVETIRSKKEENQAPDIAEKSGPDVPLYLKFFAGATLGATLGGAIGTLILPVVGTAIGTAIGAIAGSAIGAGGDVFTEIVIDPIKKFFNKHFPSEDKAEVYSKPNMEKEAPVLILATVGALSGAAIGGAIGSIVPGIGTVIGAAVGAIIGASAATIYRALQPEKKDVEVELKEKLSRTVNSPSSGDQSSEATRKLEEVVEEKSKEINHTNEKGWDPEMDEKLSRIAFIKKIHDEGVLPLSTGEDTEASSSEKTTTNAPSEGSQKQLKIN